MTFTSDSSPPALEWKFSQVFGEQSPGEDVQDIDVITTIEFEKSGDYLAVGDRGGRVVVFERKSAKDVLSEYHFRNELEQLDFLAMQHPEFQYKTEFQSHEPEFDCLKSMEIEEKINKVRWCGHPNGSLFILSSNDKTIKLWKVKEHKVKKVKEMEINPSVYSENALLAEKSFVSGQHEPSPPDGYSLEEREKSTNYMPQSRERSRRILHTGDAAFARCRKVYAHAHDFNINSISNNSDGETFVSADDLRVNLWNLEVSEQCFNIIDMKPSNMDDLTEVITSAEFHPLHCNLLAYSSSRGFIRLVDMRQSALSFHGLCYMDSGTCIRCGYVSRHRASQIHDLKDTGKWKLKDGDSRGFKSFFTEIIASISDIKFATNGRNILSRDYMNLKLWDLRMETSPVATYKIHEHLRPKLCDLYNNDAIFDKFDCCLSGDGHHFATGSYSNLLRIFSRGDGNEEGITMEASKTPNRKPHIQAAPRMRRSSLSNLTRGFHRHAHEKSNSGSSVDFPCNLNSKLLHMAWHPRTNFIACGAGNSLFMYYA